MIRPNARRQVFNKDIPKGCRDMFSKAGDKGGMVKNSQMKLNFLPTFKQLWKLCLYDDENYFVGRWKK
jgi:hypothetical protein